MPGSAQSPMLMLVLAALIFGAMGMVAMAIAPLVIGRVDLRRRLPDLFDGDGAVGSLRPQAGFWTKLLASIEARGVPLADNDPDGLRSRLVRAGFTHPEAPRLFALAKVVLAVLPPLLVFGTSSFLGRSLSPMQINLLACGGALIGLYAPNLIVSSRAAQRTRDILNGFPDTLDLMLVCVQAGLGLDAVFSRVGSEVVRSHPLLAQQFAMVSLELRAGRGREDALRNLAARTASPEIRSFVTLLIQSEKLGSSLSQTLRVYAAEMRERRRMRAEEKAHRLPVLLSIPLVLFILPTMFAVLLLPGAIRVIRELLPALAT